MAKKGEYVRIHRVVLKADERTAKLPLDTKKCDLEMWTKGFLLEDAEIGDMAEIETVVGRKEFGKLIDDAPNYTHSYGNSIPEIIEIDNILRKEMGGIE
ncbi:MAG: 2-amino-4-oxopentanoate thiolase subunit OrtA [Hornefia sp.]|nr:2-amino-4-oxopentanoate thiolase subunit OrtA [Hornefia sp.]